MKMTSLVQLIRRVGRIAEPAAPAPTPAAADNGFTAPHQLHGSVQVRSVDTGSCNGCELEIAAAFGPVYDVERYGARLVASPRHADALLVSGVVTHNMSEPLRLTYAATPDPKVVIACGDCALGHSVFREGYGVAGAVDDLVPVDLAIPGCPPSPADIVAALRKVTGR